MKLNGVFLNRSGKIDAGNRTLTRSMDGEIGAIDTEKRTVEVAFSSEAEYERWFGLEILDHSPESVDLSRLNNSAPVLVNHDTSDQVAVVESARIDPDRKGRAVLRFGRSRRAEEIFQDIVDGIRKHVSVGYRILDAVREGIRDEKPIVRIMRWFPSEISMASVPADNTVGVGRSEIPQVEAGNPTVENGLHIRTAIKGEQMEEKILRDASGNLVRAKVDDSGNIVEVTETLEKAGAGDHAIRTHAEQAERQRVQSILEMGQRYRCDDIARQYVAEGKSVADFQAAVLEAFNERASRPLNEQTRGAGIGMTDSEADRFSFMRAIRALKNPNDRKAQEDAAFEFECSRAAEQEYGRSAQGILIPADVLNRAFNAGGAANTPTGSTTGAGLVATELLAGSFIQLLRNRTAIMRMATTMAGLIGNVEIPKQTGGATAYWVAEGGDATEGVPTIGQIGLSPKDIAAYTDITRRLMMQSTPDAEMIVRNDLINALAQGIDLAGYYGSGSGNEPKGLKNYTGINAVTFATAGKPTFAELVSMESEVAADNADIGHMGFIGNARFRGHCKTTPKFGSGTEATIWEQGGTVNGYRTEITNQVKDGDVFFGNFADLIIGLWGGLDLTVDPYSLSKSGGTRIVVFQSVDMVLRRVESICYGAAAPASGGD